MSKLMIDYLRPHLKDTIFHAPLSAATTILNTDALRGVINGDVNLESLPAITPPFRHTFVETDIPFLTLGQSRGGVLLFRADYQEMPTVELMDNSEPRWVLTAYVFLDPRRFPIGAPLVRAYLMLDADGQPMPLLVNGEAGYSVVEPDEGMKVLDPLFKIGEQMKAENVVLRELHKGEVIYEPEISQAQFERFGAMLLDAALFTCGMLHCKNIVADDVEPNHAVSKKHARKYGEPLTRYKVLKVTGKGSASGQLLGAGGHSGQNALHWCRGHFRTYTEDAPLFGRVTGTFWVDPHVRGHGERGTITKDYEIGKQERTGG